MYFVRVSMFIVCIGTLVDIAPAKCQQNRYQSEFTAASRSFPATAWFNGYSITLLSLQVTTCILTINNKLQECTKNRPKRIFSNQWSVFGIFGIWYHFFKFSDINLFFKFAIAQSAFFTVSVIFCVADQYGWQIDAIRVWTMTLLPQNCPFSVLGIFSLVGGIL